MVSVASGGTAERIAARSLFKVLRAGSGMPAKYSSTFFGAALPFAAELRLPDFAFFTPAMLQELLLSSPCPRPPCSRSTELAFRLFYRCSGHLKTARENCESPPPSMTQRAWMTINYYFSVQRREKCLLSTSPFIEPGYCCGVSCQTVPWLLPQAPVVP